MAFRPLTDAECGQANPLSRLTSHITQDHTFSETHGQAFPSSSDQLVEQFLQETRAIPQTYRMDDLMREMHEIESQRSALPPIPASTVKDTLHDDAWAQQYLEDGKTFHDHTVDHGAVWSEILSQERNNLQNIDNVQDIWKDATDVPFDLNDKDYTGEEDSSLVYSKFMKFMKSDETGDPEGVLTSQEASAWSKEYFDAKEAGTSNQSQEFLANDQNSNQLADNWAEEHLKNEDDFNSQFWEKIQEDMKKVVAGEDLDHSWLEDFNTYYNAPQKEYEFSENNPMFDIKNPLERGKTLLEEGDFPSAVLCFEAAVKQNPENAEAWLLLGKTHAENEQDPNAIPALNRCLQIENTNLEALMALAVSYTNESYYNQACLTLLSWIKNNPKYQDLVPTNLNLTGQVTSFLDPSQQKIVQDLYIKAAQRNPLDVDYEVQCGLGVLFNLTSEYDKAADCFRAALSAKPEDARLWNRLGATLANGSRPEEAVDAYHHALNLSPGFIRARYNVGITCINLNSYIEAAEHFLTALNQQARGRDINDLPAGSQMSDTIWSTLRMCISLMNRSDLKPAVDNRDLSILNKAFNIGE